MKHYSTYLFLRMFSCFKASMAFVLATVKPEDIDDIEIVVEKETNDGHVGIIRFKGQKYIMQIHPIKSSVEVKPSVVDMAERIVENV